MPAQRPYDIVLFGATGFTGRLTAGYLAANAPAGLRWALAGRSTEKLEAVRAELAEAHPGAPAPELLKADVIDEASITAVAEAARVVITTVGPYLQFGEPLVAACAAAGTDYVDLTGEPEFVDRMYLAHHDRAVASGARIVHACGFDSIPHDLGALFTVRQLPEGVPLRVDAYVSANGEFSGGTYHSAIGAFSRLRQSAAAAKERRAKEGRPEGRRVGNSTGRPRRERAADGWAVPMPTIDPQIVLRSAAALERYGPDFRYGHWMAIKRLPVVAGLLGGVGTAVALAQLPPTRKLLLKLKAQGDGPSPERRAKSWFRVRFVGEGGGRRVVCEVRGGDAGYEETSKMLAESALCLAFDDLPETAGQVTTAVAMGDALTARLQKAGITFEVVEGGQAAVVGNGRPKAGAAA